MDKVILTVATTGAWPTKNENPYVPLHPEEIADEVFACYQAGASVAHIHVRDNHGRPTMDLDKFERTVRLIRDRCDIVINLTTSGDLGLDDDERMKPFIELKPELASFDCGSMNWGHSTTFINSPPFLEKLGQKMKENHVKPEIEVFDSGMFYNAEYYLKKGVLDAPAHYQFVLGAPGGMVATIDNLVFLKNLLPKEATWGAFGIGRMHMPILYATLALGGHIRVGMEDNVYYSKGVLAKSNVEFVERAKRVANELGRELSTPDEARKILGLKGRSRVEELR
ncbi:3-keto-5-aminohexanoate cleavage protein [Halalkalibacter okhensis]|uniref:3-keto-5-aminohexanoate cleavage protein n=1 Tax=Halalkalibacter okhensis TaxID=333138 RepID=A0A0B0IDN9_9BACI|nr:3-keto-5-aminohexanoate cleavage protein [Halalkalibacter okhensis]KHF39370.1 3-keto-5-aminohexanoate cleavage protein [Halalkalibacter okhensis]